MSGRSLRAQRKAKQEMRNGLFFTDEAVKWQGETLLENKLDEAPFTLRDGTPVPQSWPTVAEINKEAK